jgi:biotin transport system permease protein
MIVGAYLPGTSLVHRAPAGPKLAVMGLGVAVLTIWRTPWVLGISIALFLATLALARIGVRPLWIQIRYAVVVALLVALGQWWISGSRAGVLVAGSLVIAVAAASLVTLTTRTSDLLEALVRGLSPLRRFGVDVDRFALLLALTVRAVPVIARLAEEVRDARRARGAERSFRALAVPLVIRTVRYADRLGDALIARGVDD